MASNEYKQGMGISSAFIFLVLVHVEAYFVYGYKSGMIGGVHSLVHGNIFCHICLYALDKIIF